MIIYQLQDPDAHTPYVKAAMDAGITVLCGLGHINDNGASLFLEVNPEQQGTLPAQYLADQGILKRGTKVAILRGVDATFHAEGRLDGFTKVIHKVGANLIASLSANYRTSEAQPIVENWLVSNPDLEVILCANDDMALGAISAIELAGKKGIVVTGIDANELGCIALKQDKMPATVAQPTLDLAYKAMDFAAQVVRGGKPQSLNLDSTLVLKKDADQILKDIHGYTQAKIDAIR
jgi:ABC-type sugar transport system substrate-binding protein